MRSVRITGRRTLLGDVLAKAHCMGEAGAGRTHENVEDASKVKGVYWAMVRTNDERGEFGVVAKEAT